ncbi:bifunctional riboflavin kinase/FAD synthetase [Nostoc sp. XA010]|uniref:bifunctional riboflavin kinase/FAD synthetase n=1 Tax=Nostoc sp. XA010 TaxID=2780407 RepID=UPI001E4AEE03|nr:bifunctional riboflavin kinase/FAD synthetase [Nostoc sp. XA010]MCC5661234.1 bifunctional riboflavin kinase/FAD synthetase [Nostoc sp. XA010]
MLKTFEPSIMLGSLTSFLTPTAVALGNFDGLHRGHQKVIESILNSQNFYPTVVTFNPHPREFFSGKRCPLLTPVNEKVQQLRSLGVKQVVSLPFNQELAALSPQHFVEKILVQDLQAQQISVGHDFRFGYQRSGTAIDLQAIAATFGIPVTIVSPHTHEGERISSTSIRKAIEQGELQRAKALLGSSYTLTGSVVRGEQMGQIIGLLTANLQLPKEKLLPRHGVYAVKVFIEDRSESEWNSKIPLAYKGVMNIGYCLTVNGERSHIKVHLLDWSGSLYGKTLTIQLEKFLRSQQEFASLEALKAQIQADCTMARTVLTDFSELGSRLEISEKILLA